MELDLALVLTAGGAVASSALITGLIQLLKALPGLGDFLDEGREKFVAFGLSGALVAVAAAATGAVTDPATGFAAFLAWYGIARLSMGIYDDGTSVKASLTKSEG
jgi:hypothetical protein